MSCFDQDSNFFCALCSSHRFPKIILFVPFWPVYWWTEEKLYSVFFHLPVPKNTLANKLRNQKKHTIIIQSIWSIWKKDTIHWKNTRKWNHSWTIKSKNNDIISHEPWYVPIDCQLSIKHLHFSFSTFSADESISGLSDTLNTFSK